MDGGLEAVGTGVDIINTAREEGLILKAAMNVLAYVVDGPDLSARRVVPQLLYDPPYHSLTYSELCMSR